MDPHEFRLGQAYWYCHPRITYYRSKNCEFKVNSRPCKLGSITGAGTASNPVVLTLTVSFPRIESQTLWIFLACSCNNCPRPFTCILNFEFLQSCVLPSTTTSILKGYWRQFSILHSVYVAVQCAKTRHNSLWP